jgi:signal peptidase I
MITSPSISKIVTWSILALLLVVLLLKTMFVGYYRIPQNGMYPGLPAGSTLFTAKRAYSSAAQVRRGDIVVFVRDEGGQRYNYIWRVVGLPGETITAAAESLTMNGQPVLRERVREEAGGVIFRERIGDVAYEIALKQSLGQTPPDMSITVPPEHFFVMGDNRLDARDSRHFGPIAFSTIIGRKL